MLTVLETHYSSSLNGNAREEQAQKLKLRRITQRKQGLEEAADRRGDADRIVAEALLASRSTHNLHSHCKPLLTTHRIGYPVQGTPQDKRQ